VATFGLNQPWTGEPDGWEAQPTLLTSAQRSIFQENPQNYIDGAPIGDRPLMDYRFGIFEPLYKGMNLFNFVIIPEGSIIQPEIDMNTEQRASMRHFGGPAPWMVTYDRKTTFTATGPVFIIRPTQIIEGCSNNKIRASIENMMSSKRGLTNEELKDLLNNHGIVDIEYGLTKEERETGWFQTKERQTEPESSQPAWDAPSSLSNSDEEEEKQGNQIDSSVYEAQEPIPQRVLRRNQEAIDESVMLGAVDRDMHRQAIGANQFNFDNVLTLLPNETMEVSHFTEPSTETQRALISRTHPVIVNSRTSYLFIFDDRYWRLYHSRGRSRAQ